MDAVLESFQDDVFIITLNRPDRKNAMNTDLLVGLLKSLEKAQKERAKVVVIRGSGKAFCAGGDLVEFRESQDPGARIDAMADTLHKSIKKIREIDAIVISVIEGVAVGAGIGLALACDLTIATKSSIMNMGYRRVGLTPDGGGSIFLPRLMGAKRFNEFYLLSRNIDMNEAKELGFINFIYEEEELEAKLLSLIQNLKSLPMETIGRFKDLVNNSCYFGLDIHLDKEKQYVSELATDPLFKERLNAFFSKR